MCGTVTDIAKLSPNIKCTTSCYEYYDDLQCSNLLFISSTLFSFLGAYRSLLKNSTERFIKILRKGLLKSYWRKQLRWYFVLITLAKDFSENISFVCPRPLFSLTSELFPKIFLHFVIMKSFWRNCDFIMSSHWCQNQNIALDQFWR